MRNSWLEHKTNSSDQEITSATGLAVHVRWMKLWLATDHSWGPFY